MKVRELKTATQYMPGETEHVSDHENSAGHRFGMYGGTTVAVGDYLIEDKHGNIEIVKPEVFLKYYRSEDV